MTLAQLVESRSFNAANSRHRRLLENDELPVEFEQLRELQARFRSNCQNHANGPVVHLARTFAAYANDE